MQQFLLWLKFLQLALEHGLEERVSESSSGFMNVIALLVIALVPLEMLYIYTVHVPFTVKGN